MALTSYVKVTGATQGEIKGGSTQSGDKADAILCYAYEHNIEIPKDTHTGLPTGQRIHHPYTIEKAIDVASPKLFKAVCSGEQLTVQHDFYRISSDGTEELYYSIKLEEAIIVDMQHFTPETFLTESKPYTDMEKVSLTYSKMTQTYSDGNIEATDSWSGD
ncbi:type VI secretion system tube protein TssD [uncultured Shewanella sp.]|uniref:type VI secretion system tube protein TssD n=1 Tax=uncultured Shewanella sp. TaxID=173975 RepID=UPI00262F3331|nr:type VI secretion system tube protein TssD [uncultured Shewanella sp.]